MPIRPTSRSLALSLSLAAACAAPLARPAAADAAAPPPGRDPAAPRLVRVSGEGRVMVRPDVAVVLVGADATGKDLAKVVDDAAARMRRVQAALLQTGIAERDVRTTRHDVQVDRNYASGGRGEITGYSVSDEVRVVVRDLARLGTVLERVVAAGSNALRGLSFEKDDPAPERREALARAVADARAKAEVLARASGVALGEVLEIAEGGARPVVPLQRGVAAMAMRAEAAPVSPGELEITAGADVTWAIR
jgi:uncharacterized protein